MSEQENVTPITKQCPQDLSDKVKALKQLINTHDLLNQGSFPGHMNKRIAESLDFVSALHKQLLGEVQSHPDFAEFKSELTK